MGRRSLPKIDASVELSRHLMTVEQLPDQLTAASIFGRPMPLEVEVGSGKGLFLLNAARAHPLRGYLGVEILHKYARFAAARLAKYDLDNARLIHADAQAIFAEKILDQSIHAVHVYFPDPWWKKRHRRRRVMTDTFIDHVLRVLVPGGRLHFWTDVLEYFESTLDLIAAKNAFAGPFEVEEQPPLHDLDFRTHFERRVRQNRLPVFRAEFAKPSWRSEYWTELTS